jgi:hypothetical protein
MAKIRLATIPKTDGNGYVHGSVTVTETVKTVTSTSNDKRDINYDSTDVECFELIFNTETLDSKPFRLTSAIFGTSVNPIPSTHKRIGSKNIPIYNKFTTVLMRLNILDKPTLDRAKTDISVLDTDTIQAEFLAIKDLPVKFKTGKNSKGFIEPDLLSLEVTGEMPNSDDLSVEQDE